MDSHASTPPEVTPRKPRPPVIVIVGHVVSVLVTLLFLMSATFKFMKPEEMMEGFTGHLGYQEHHAFWIGLTELACAIIYVIPRTSVLGAILLTGYLGGAVATHVRVGDPFMGPIIIGVVVWAALFLRDARIRSLIPIRW